MSVIIRIMPTRKRHNVAGHRGGVVGGDHHSDSRVPSPASGRGLPTASSECQAIRPNHSIDSPAAARASSAPAPAKMKAISVSFFSLISRVESES